MLLKDLSVGGIAKILLIVNLGFPMMWAPIFALYYFYKPDQINIDWKINFFNIGTINVDPGVGGVITLVVGFVISAVLASWFSAIVIKFLAAYSPLGGIKLTAPYFDNTFE